MKREIKFRGKDQFDKLWVYGDLSLTHCYGATIFNGIRHMDGLEYRIDGEFQVFPETVGQFTGMIDKNGLEIYEGDIIRLPDSPYTREGSFEVFFHDGCFFAGMAINKQVKEPLWWMLNHGAYKIGNIYDNLELVEERK